MFTVPAVGRTGNGGASYPFPMPGKPRWPGRWARLLCPLHPWEARGDNVVLCTARTGSCRCRQHDLTRWAGAVLVSHLTPRHLEVITPTSLSGHAEDTALVQHGDRRSVFLVSEGRFTRNPTGGSGPWTWGDRPAGGRQGAVPVTQHPQTASIFLTCACHVCIAPRTRRHIRGWLVTASPWAHVTTACPWGRLALGRPKPAQCQGSSHSGRGMFPSGKHLRSPERRVPPWLAGSAVQTTDAGVR